MWVEATLRLLRSFAHHGGRRATVAGSCAEYDWVGQDRLLSERRTPLRPATLYGVSKNATRSVAEAFANQAGFELAWGRIFFVYGPGEARARLVPSVITSLLEGRPACVSDGFQVRDFIYVGDVGAPLWLDLESNVHGAVNIGSGDGVTVRKVVEEIGALTGRADLIEFGAVATPDDEALSVVADVGRLVNEVGFSPRTRIYTGLEESVDWWRSTARRHPLRHGLT